MYIIKYLSINSPFIYKSLASNINNLDSLVRQINNKGQIIRQIIQTNCNKYEDITYEILRQIKENK